MDRKENHIKETKGSIIKVHFNSNGSRRVTVKYVVDGNTYHITENITVKSEAIKIGFLPIGQKKIEYIQEGLGEQVVVMYNSAEPKEAYLRDNIGNHV